MVKVIIVHKASDIPKEPIDGKPTLVYWNILGLAQYIRLALVQAGVDFVDVRIEAGDPTKNEYKKAWFDAKPGLAQDVMCFPNLPYYLEDGGVALYQSDAIVRFVGRKYSLLNGNETKIDVALDELKDLIMGIVGVAYPLGHDGVAAWYNANATLVLSKWEKFFEGKD